MRFGVVELPVSGSKNKNVVRRRIFKVLRPQTLKHIRGGGHQRSIITITAWPKKKNRTREKNARNFFLRPATYVIFLCDVDEPMWMTYTKFWGSITKGKDVVDDAAKNVCCWSFLKDWVIQGHYCCLSAEVWDQKVSFKLKTAVTNFIRGIPVQWKSAGESCTASFGDCTSVRCVRGVIWNTFCKTVVVASILARMTHNSGSCFHINSWLFTPDFIIFA